MLAVGSVARAQAPAAPAPASAQSSAKAICPPPGDLNPKPGEHPLDPLIRWGKAGTAGLEKVEDYSCRLVKRERVDGRLNNHEWVTLKVRHQPFSVYAAFVNKQDRPWQEVVYMADRHAGKMFAHSDTHRLMGTVSLFPDSQRAMREGRYPLTEVGVLNLIRRLVQRAENDVKYDDCEVKVYENAKIEDRLCHYIRVTHKEKRPEFSFNIVRIFIDNKLNVPVRYEAFTWPEEKDGTPVLQEEYTYLDFQFNRGFTDRDFDINNPEYFFPPDYEEPKVDLAGDAPVAQLPADSPIALAKPVSDPSPLAGALAIGRETQTRLDQARDYACLFSQRELAGGKLPERSEHMLIKIRSQPQSVYAFFLGPQTPKGEEAIFVAGANDGKALAHPAPTPGQKAPARAIDPKGAELVRSTGVPINEVGIKTRLASWIDLHQAELPHGECQVRYLPRVQVDLRNCTCIEISHPTQRPHFKYHMTRMYIDDEWKTPVRFEAYGWPGSSTTPPLVAEMTYRNLETNRGFAPEDFDPTNPNYTFDTSRQR
jgi:outer membrane lipoprotein-sorting protein